MAIYRIQANAISRKRSGAAEGAPERSAVASAAYRAGEKLYDQRQGKTHDFRRKGFVTGSEILAPEHAPESLRDRETLWNSVEATERRKDSCVARELELSLPRELSRNARRALVREFVGEILTKRGLIADVTYHNPLSKRDGYENPHAHVLYTTRFVTAQGLGPKDRSLEAGRVKLFQTWRELWETKVNAYLERARRPERVDRRSLKAQGIARLPEPKIGVSAWAMEKKGFATERVQHWRETVHANALALDAPLPIAELTLSGVAPWTPEQILSRLFV